MNPFFAAQQTKDTVTNNGMLTNSSTLSGLLDFYGIVGASRLSIQNNPNNLISKFEASIYDDTLLTFKKMFQTRDIRSGLGERATFRLLLNHAAISYPEIIRKNLPLIAYFGRWDDYESLLLLDKNNVIRQETLFLIKSVLANDISVVLRQWKHIDMEIIINVFNTRGLLGKWLKRPTGSKENRILAGIVRTYLRMDRGEYRRLLSKLSSEIGVVEQKMSAKDFGSIDYEKVPSVAMLRYKKSFLKNDTERFNGYKIEVTAGTKKVNAGTLYPYNIISQLRKSGHENYDLTVQQWKALPDYTMDNSIRPLFICDVSGSMNTVLSGNITAMDVATSLTLYFSERMPGYWADACMTFSAKPEFVKLNGDLKARYVQLLRVNWGMNTNLELAFTKLLEQSVKNDVKKDEMPNRLFIVSDMQFDSCVDANITALDMIKTKYLAAGYDIPEVVFWQVNATSNNFPIQHNDKGVCLVSGLSPVAVKSALSGKSISPIEVILDELNDVRYDCVSI